MAESEWEPFDWTVVVAGHWNRAILTPAGILEHLFELPRDTVVTVEVPLDGVSPYHVRCNQIVVVAGEDRLTIGHEQPAFVGLEPAMGLAAAAVRNLPQTPFTAAGFNVRYRSGDVPANLLEATSAGLDSRLSKASYSIQSWELRRTVAMWESGVMNLTVEYEETAVIQMNFHRSSRHGEELQRWLETPIGDIRHEVHRVAEALAIRLPGS